MKKTKAYLKLKPHQKVVHHAKRAYHMTPKFVHGMVAGAFVGIVVVTSLGTIGQANALTISSPRDCDSNAVINCGTLTTAELQQRYNNAGVAAIYSYFGISPTDIKNTGTTAVAGLVYKDGTITVGNKTVATGAVTAGRQNITGSTKVTSGGVTFYTRQPSVSFRPNSLAAFVIMENGQFKFAVLGACGNPVTGTPVPRTPRNPEPTPQIPTPVTPVPTTPTPPETPTPSTQTPPSTPVVETVAATELPKTGAGTVLVVAALSILGGYIFHMTHRHVKHKRKVRHA